MALDVPDRDARALTTMRIVEHEHRRPGRQFVL
jgi:hypothetical protein